MLGQEGVYHKFCTLNDIIIKSDNKVVVIDFANTPAYETIAEVQAQVTAWTAFAQSQGEDIANSIFRFCWKHSGEFASHFLEWASDLAIVSRVPNWQKLKHSTYLPMNTVG